MRPVPLPQDLASLVHHVELSEAGWRERAIRHLLLAAISKHPNGVFAEEAYTEANTSLPGPLAPAELARQVDSLRSRGRIIQLPNGNLKLTEEAGRKIEKQLANAATRQVQVKKQFDAAFSALPPRIDLEWKDFLDSCLIPLVSELGAKTYQILTGQDAGIEDTTSYLAFLNRFDEEDRVPVCDAIATFIDSSSPVVRAYVLRLLNTAFLVRALTLPAGAVQKLLRRTRQRLHMRVFVDTNFLFSLLGLDSPADSVVGALHDLIANMPSRLDVRLYMLPCTMDEACETIARYEGRLSSFYMNRHVAEAIRQGQLNLSGIALTYIDEAYGGGKRISSKDYFAPYLKNFIGVARSKGVEVFNASLEKLRMDQQVLDDVAEQFEREQKRPKGRAKSYEALRHDMMLWHFARRQRPERIDSPLDAIAWVATLDYGLLRFDAFKGRLARKEPAVCIHPTVLLQILQFWVPNNESLEAALMTSLRPVPPRFDSEAERVTVRILSALSRFEGIDDLSGETVTNVLLSDVVRGRIGRGKNPEADLEAVRTGVTEENRVLGMRARRYRKEAEGLSRTMDQRDETIGRLQDEMKGVVGEREAVGAELVAVRASREEIRRELARVQTEAEVTKGELRRSKARRAAYWSAGVRGLVAAAGSSAVAAFVAWLLRARFADVSTFGAFTAIVTWFIVAMGLATETAVTVLNRTEAGRSTAVAEWLGGRKKWCWRVVTAVLIGVLVAGLVSMGDG